MRHNHPELFETVPVSRSFFDTYNEYLDTTQDGTKLSSHYKVLARLLDRYEKYKRKSTRQKFQLTLEDFNGAMVDDFKQFVIDEPKIYEKFPSIYKEPSNVVETARKPRKPEQRGHNAVIAIMKRLRAFFNWCVKRGYITRTPFASCTSIGAENMVCRITSHWRNVTRLLTAIFHSRNRWRCNAIFLSSNALSVAECLTLWN